MNTLDERITGALRDRATGDVDVESLLDGARRRGLRHRRTHRVSGAAVAVGTVAAIIAGTVVALSQSHGQRGAAIAPSVSATTNGSAPADGGLRPPDAAPGAVPATANPKVIASDAKLFHIDIDLRAAGLTTPVTRFEWNSQIGSESLSLEGPNPSSDYPRIVASRDRDSLFADGPLGQHSQAVKVAGKPATLWSTDGSPAETVLWQPLHGVWATVAYLGEQRTIRVAEAVRFNHVMRCTVPFTLTTVASGAWMDSCTVTVSAAGVSATVEIRITKGWGVLVESQPRADASPVNPTTTINGHPASTSQDPPGTGTTVSIGHIHIDYGERIIGFVGFIAHGPTLLQVAKGFRPIAGDDPTRWPANPLS